MTERKLRGMSPLRKETLERAKRLEEKYGNRLRGADVVRLVEQLGGGYRLQDLTLQEAAGALAATELILDAAFADRADPSPLPESSS